VAAQADIEETTGFGIAANAGFMEEAARGTKRRVDADAEMDLGDLVNRLGATCTDDHDRLIALVVDVTGADPSDATFYLEACSWNPNDAIQQALCNKRSRPAPPAPMLSPAFRPRPLEIVGLPDGWSARVNSAGTISFQHHESGHEQHVVPPGFADETAPNLEGGTSEADTAMGQQMAGEVNLEIEQPPMPTDMGVEPSMATAAELHYSAHHLHSNVVCDGCEGPICGRRYQCVTRANTDLCEGCMRSKAPGNEALRRGQTWLEMQLVSVQ